MADITGYYNEWADTTSDGTDFYTLTTASSLKFSQYYQMYVKNKLQSMMKEFAFKEIFPEWYRPQPQPDWTDYDYIKAIKDAAIH